MPEQRENEERLRVTKKNCKYSLIYCDLNTLFIIAESRPSSKVDLGIPQEFRKENQCLKARTKEEIKV